MLTMPMIGSLYGMAVEIVQRKSKPKSKPSNVPKLSEEKTLITHIDDGFQFWAIKFRVTNAGQMDSGACFHEYPKGDSTLSRCRQGNYPKHVHR